MGKFDKYILSQLLVSFSFYALVLVLVYWVNRAVALFDQILSNGESALVFFVLSALTLPTVVGLVLPIAAFAAAITVNNRLTSESELVVVQAAGYGPFRLLRPVLMFGVLTFFMMSALVHVLIPASTAELMRRTVEITENVTARLLREGQFVHPTDGMTFYIREITPEGELKGLFLSDRRDPATSVTYTAERALLVRDESGPKLLMFDGQSQILRASDNALAVTRFKDFAFDIGALMNTDYVFRHNRRTLPTAALLNPTEQQLEEARASRERLAFEGHRRIADSLGPMMAALLGFAALLVGGYSRFGLWKQIAVAIAVVVVIVSLKNVFDEMAQKSLDMLWASYVYLGLEGLAVLAFAGLASAPRRRPGAWPWRRGAPREAPA